MSSTAKHVILVNPPLYGHAIALCRLGVLLTEFHRITFVVPANLLTRLQNDFKYAKHGSHGPVRFVGLQPKNGGSDDMQIKVSEGDPLVAMFRDLYPIMRDFFRALATKILLTPLSDAKKDYLSFILSGDVEALHNPVHAIIADNFLGGPVSVVYSYGLPYYLFNSCKAQAMLMFLNLHIDEPASFRDSVRIPAYFTRRSVGSKYTALRLEENKHLLMDNCLTVHLAAGIIVNSVRECEKNIHEILQCEKMAGMKLFFVGPLLPPKFERSERKSEKDTMISWLDRQKQKSVIYISFGSLTVLPPNVVKEIGKALLSLEIPFIWSLTPDLYVNLPDNMLELRKTEESCPFFLAGWVPQEEVLAHPAVKVFVSHCGWNSVIESLSWGVPIVGWPMFADQLINAEWLEQEGVGKLIRGTGIAMGNAASAVEQMLAIVQEVSKTGNSFTVCAENWRENIAAAWATGGCSRVELLELNSHISCNTGNFQ